MPVALPMMNWICFYDGLDIGHGLHQHKKQVDIIAHVIRSIFLRHQGAAIHRYSVMMNCDVQVAQDEVKRIQNLLYLSIPPEIIMTEVTAILQKGDFIGAVRCYRQFMNTSLLNAKHQVEKIRDALRKQGILPPAS